MNHYLTSSGERVTQTQINSRLAKMRNTMLHSYICECCGINQANDHDHSISQKRCKHIHKAELIYDEDNVSFSCRTCHMAFESLKSGEFQHHKNVVKRMLFIKKHDWEGYQKRLAYITDQEVLKQLE